MKLGIEERTVSTQCGSITITVVRVPAPIQESIAKGLELGPQALATMYQVGPPVPPAGPAGEKK